MGTGFLKQLINAITGRHGGAGGKFSKVSDEDLVRMYIETGDEAAFEAIVGRYADKIYGFALRITRDTGSAEEVFQEVFLTLTKKIDTFRGESKFSSWLYRVSLNTSYMHLRARKKFEKNLSLENYAPYDENGTLMGKIKNKDFSDRPDIAIFRKEALDIIENAVDELPESYRTVFHLRDIEGMTNEEVSEVLDISVPAVKSRLHRARLFLRDRLSEYFNEWRR
ncbi:MAG: sigma-70 family RNA polymerase sigma factor [Deltaproteobacteria bacterium]